MSTNSEMLDYDYPEYLKAMPRPERRRELKAFMKRAQYENSKAIRVRDEERRLEKIKKALEAAKAKRDPWRD